MLGMGLNQNTEMLQDLHAKPRPKQDGTTGPSKWNPVKPSRPNLTGLKIQMMHCHGLLSKIKFLFKKSQLCNICVHLFTSISSQNVKNKPHPETINLKSTKMFSYEHRTQVHFESPIFRHDLICVKTFWIAIIFTSISYLYSNIEGEENFTKCQISVSSPPLTCTKADRYFRGQSWSIGVS